MGDARGVGNPGDGETPVHEVWLDAFEIDATSVTNAQFARFVDETGIDGFNLAYVVMPESFTDLVDLVIPELQSRGRFKTAYRPGTLREKLYGTPRLSSGHPAAAFRR